MQITTQSDATRIYDYIKARSLEPGTLYSKSELTAVLGKPFDAYRTAIYSVIGRMERNDQRTLVCVTGVGYRVAHPSETATIAARRRKRAKGQITKGLRTVKGTDVSFLTQQERQELTSVMSGMAALEKDMKRIEKRIAIGEARIDALEQEDRLTAAEIHAFRDLLARAAQP